MLTPEQMKMLKDRFSDVKDYECWDCEKRLEYGELEDVYMSEMRNVEGYRMIICKKCGEKEGRLL